MSGGAEIRGSRPGREHPATGLPRSLLLVRVFPDRVEVCEQITSDRTEALLRAIRRLGVAGEVVFRTPCG